MQVEDIKGAYNNVQSCGDSHLLPESVSLTLCHHTSIPQGQEGLGSEQSRAQATRSYTHKFLPAWPAKHKLDKDSNNGYRTLANRQWINDLKPMQIFIGKLGMLRAEWPSLEKNTAINCPIFNWCALKTYI